MANAIINMHFSINSQRVMTKSELSNVLPALLAANQTLVPAPKVIARSIPPRDHMRIDILPYECAFIDTTNLEQSDCPKNDPFYFHAHRVNKGISLYFYNDRGERLMLAMTSIANIPYWENLFSNFKKCTDIKVIITGGTDNKIDHNAPNNCRILLGEVISGLFNFACNSEFSINIAAVKLIENNTINKYTLCESMTPYLYFTLNELSNRYSKTELKTNISFFNPASNFKNNFIGEKHHLEAAASIASSIHPHETVPFEKLPDIGAQSSDDYIPRLAEILFTKQALKMLSESFCDGDAADLGNFMIDCDTHTYFRVNNFYDVIPNFAPRIAKSLEQHLLKRHNLVFYSIESHQIAPEISLDPTMMVFLRNKLMDYHLIKRKYIELFIDTQIPRLDLSLFELGLLKRRIEDNTRILSGLLKQLNPLDEALESFSRELLCILNHYLRNPADFICDSPLSGFGFFSKGNNDHLGYCKALLNSIIGGARGLSIKIYRIHNSIDVLSDDYGFEMLKKIAEILDSQGFNTSMSRLENGLHVIRLAVSAALVKSLSDTYIDIEIAARKFNDCIVIESDSDDEELVKTLMRTIKPI